MLRKEENFSPRFGMFRQNEQNCCEFSRKKAEIREKQAQIMPNYTLLHLEVKSTALDNNFDTNEQKNDLNVWKT